MKTKAEWIVTFQNKVCKTKHSKDMAHEIICEMFNDFNILLDRVNEAIDEKDAEIQDLELVNRCIIEANELSKENFEKLKRRIDFMALMLEEKNAKVDKLKSSLEKEVKTSLLYRDKLDNEAAKRKEFVNECILLSEKIEKQKQKNRKLKRKLLR